jgi:hypothetical protein
MLNMVIVHIKKEINTFFKMYIFYIGGFYGQAFEKNKN